MNIFEFSLLVFILKLTMVKKSNNNKEVYLQKRNRLFEQLNQLKTESINNFSLDIDKLPTAKILAIINSEDAKVPHAVCKELPYIAKAVEIIVNAIKSGGRLIYIGAGTSGRLGVLDSAEIPPTYGTNPNLVQAIIAGDKKAVFRAQEGSEDNIKEAVKFLKKKRVNNKDVVCGIAASIRTPFVVSGLKYAKSVGAKTILITTNSRQVIEQKSYRFLKKIVDVSICPDVGAEIIMGSTRMKSGTAQKLVLNMISTATMIRLGKVYENMMVDLKLNSRKLKERAKRVIMNITGVNYRSASAYLNAANGNVKTAIVMIKSNVSAREAHRRLKSVGGFVRLAIDKERR